MSITLPPSAMEHIANFLDARDLGTMAQVNSAWKTLAYRNSVWKKLLWKPKTGADSLFESYTIPKHARHIGAQTQACFLAWAKHTIAECNLGYGPEKLYAYWKALGKPCVVMNHHHMWDVCRAAPVLKSMSKDEQKYYYYRLISYNSISGLNDIVVYLMNQCTYLEKRHSLGLNMMVHDPFRDLRLAVHKAKQIEYSVYEKKADDLKKVYEACIRLLQSHGVVEFDTNDRVVKANPEKYYSLVAFSLTRS
jgi:hypothetical protein